tara:strand:- start:492 stop:659 length:168 start_codon:yes stop_codon:yes gene_type:complete
LLKNYFLEIKLLNATIYTVEKIGKTCGFTLEVLWINKHREKRKESLEEVLKKREN